MICWTLKPNQVWLGQRGISRRPQNCEYISELHLCHKFIIIWDVCVSNSLMAIGSCFYSEIYVSWYCGQLDSRISVGFISIPGPCNSFLGWQPIAFSFLKLPIQLLFMLAAVLVSLFKTALHTSLVQPCLPLANSRTLLIKQLILPIGSTLVPSSFRQLWSSYGINAMIFKPRYCMLC